MSPSEPLPPESYLNPSHLYEAMKAEIPVSTSQASIAERHECYNKVLKLHGRVLYLCVGSFFTGNYSTVMRWKAENDQEDRMTVIDTGVASGKLGSSPEPRRSFPFRPETRRKWLPLQGQRFATSRSTSSWTGFSFWLRAAGCQRPALFSGPPSHQAHCEPLSGRRAKDGCGQKQQRSGEVCVQNP